MWLFTNTLWLCTSSSRWCRWRRFCWSCRLVLVLRPNVRNSNVQDLIKLDPPSLDISKQIQWKLITNSSIFILTKQWPQPCATVPHGNLSWYNKLAHNKQFDPEFLACYMSVWLYYKLAFILNLTWAFVLIDYNQVWWLNLSLHDTTLYNCSFADITNNINPHYHAENRALQLSNAVRSQSTGSHFVGVSLWFNLRDPPPF